MANGGVAIMRLLNDARTPQEEIARMASNQQAVYEQPLVIREIQEGDIPASRSFRNDWQDTGSIDVNMVRARASHKTAILRERDKEVRSDAADHAIAEIENDTAEAARLRGKIGRMKGLDTALDAELNSKTTPSDLEAYWPPDVSRPPS